MDQFEIPIANTLLVRIKEDWSRVVRRGLHGNQIHFKNGKRWKNVKTQN